jgi:hypothetical protein
VGRPNEATAARTTAQPPVAVKRFSISTAVI